MILSSCNPYGKGDKSLIVEIASKSEEESLIRQILNKGGSITLNVEVLRIIDNEFDSKYAAYDSNRQFYTKSAIFCFVGGQRWRLLQDDIGIEYIFVKSRN